MAKINKLGKPLFPTLLGHMSLTRVYARSYYLVMMDTPPSVTYLRWSLYERASTVTLRAFREWLLLMPFN